MSAPNATQAGAPVSTPRADASMDAAGAPLTASRGGPHGRGEEDAGGFTFDVHPAWSPGAVVASARAQDATTVRRWLAEAVMAPPGPAAPWLDLERARVAAGRLATLEPGPTLVLGMGGSALGARAALAWAAADGDVAHPVRVLDTVDPEVAREHFAWQARVGARVVVISKSGTTIEILRLLDVLLDRGLDRVVFVADPVRTPMDERFAARGCAVDRFEMPADVGGRYSVLTAVGQVPLRCAGLDGHALLDGASQLRAQWIAEASREGGAAASHDADDLDAIARAIAFRLAHPAAVHVLWCYADRLLPYAAWLQQLDNESLGRHRGDGDHVGEILLPLRGPADQHSVAQLLLDGPRDKRALFLDRDAAVVPALDDGASDPFARLESLRAAEARAAFEAVGEVHPTARWVMPGTGLATLGAAFLRGMMEVVALGAATGIDPYGQPAVEAIKRRIREG